MTDVALRPAAFSAPPLYNLDRAHELRALRETLNRSFPNIDPQKVAQSIELALKAGGGHQNRAEIIELAKTYLADQ